MDITKGKYQVYMWNAWGGSEYCSAKKGKVIEVEAQEVEVINNGTFIIDEVEHVMIICKETKEIQTKAVKRSGYDASGYFIAIKQ